MFFPIYAHPFPYLSYSYLLLSLSEITNNESTCNSGGLDYTNILSKKSSAQMGFRVNPVLARNSCIQCYILLFTEIILQQFDAFKIEIQGPLTKL